MLDSIQKMAEEISNCIENLQLAATVLSDKPNRIVLEPFTRGLWVLKVYQNGVPLEACPLEIKDLNQFHFDVCIIKHFSFLKESQ